MPPIPTKTPRVVIYHQTHVHPTTRLPISLLPLLTPPLPPCNLTIIIAALHLNESPTHITLNDHPPDHAHHAHVLTEIPLLRASGTTVLAMLGGACPGTFSRLDTQFTTYYPALRDAIKALDVDGVDLDVEEPMSLSGIITLIDALRADFGAAFIITFAPVAAALLPPGLGGRNLSGFAYHDLERERGNEISWYNAQFYCGWGTVGMYARFVQMGGWDPKKVVAGVVTNPGNAASGYSDLETVAQVLMELMSSGWGFGGVMGWEYFNALPGGDERPREWVEWMANMLGSG